MLPAIENRKVSRETRGSLIFKEHQHDYERLKEESSKERRRKQAQSIQEQRSLSKELRLLRPYRDPSLDEEKPPQREREKNTRS